jgi:NAD(P)H-hydrate epimerase
MIPVVTPERMRAIDAAADVPVEQLIERAGAAVARQALRMLGGAYGRRVVVVAGPGNNGADGRVAARRLAERGVAVRIVEALDRPERIPDADLVIDAAFGTGFRGGWAFPSHGGSTVLAVDVPSGLDAMSGRAGPLTPRAAATVTFNAAKPGHYVADGPAFSGELVVADIGLVVTDPDAWVAEPSDIAAWIPPRPRDAHKWRAAVRIVAGSPGMTGAAHLAVAAAQRAGAGLVAVSSPGIDADAPIEAIDRRIPPFDWAGAVLSDLHRFRSLVLGPGLGRDEHTVGSVVRAALDAVVPVVIDGDGLFALAWNDAGTPAFLAEREVATVLTPHDGEYATLTGRQPGEDRLGAVQALVDMTGATVLLKGPTTIVGSPGHPPTIVRAGDQRLATAGTGDVLAGIIGALLARGVSAHQAAVAGALVHGEALRGCAPTGVIAGDLIAHIPDVFHHHS